MLIKSILKKLVLDSSALKISLANKLILRKTLLSVASLCLVLVSQLSLAMTDVNEFFSLPKMTLAKVSPDGLFVVTISRRDEKQVITLVDTNTRKESLLLDLEAFSSQKGSISQLEWIDNKHIAAQFTAVKKGIDELIESKKAHSLLVLARPEQIGKLAKVYSIRTNGWLVHPLSDEANNFLYAKSGLYSKVYKIDVTKLALHGLRLNKLSKVDGGQFKKSNEVKRVEGFASRWFINYNGEPEAALSLTDLDELSLTVFNESGEGNVIKTWDFSGDHSQSKKLLPVALSQEKNSFYCLDFNEEERRSVYRVNFNTNDEQIVYEADSFEILNLELSEDNSTLMAIKVINNGRIETVFLNDDNAGLGQPGLLAIVNESTDKSSTVLYMESHNNPGQFLFSEKSQKQAYVLGGHFPHLSGQLNNELIQSSLEVEGLTIPYLLTLPNKKTNEKSNQQPNDKLNSGAAKQKYPLIVMPHGGPIGVYDNIYYDQITQFLLAQNYAVLRVNFRGSSGFSPELKAAGKLQWGKLMLTDIMQATKKVLSREDINADKVCSFGMSYGGYAALMLTIKHPQIYKCAANWAGVTDINLHLNATGRSPAQKTWLRQHIGDSREDYQALKAVSPVYLADKITTPVFIAHGAKDTVVDVEHAYRMKLMLDKYGKSYQWLLDDEASHSFGDVARQRAFFSALAQFLKHNIHE